MFLSPRCIRDKPLFQKGSQILYNLHKNTYSFSLGMSMDLYFCVALVKTVYNTRRAQQFRQNIVCHMQYVNKSVIHSIPKVLQHHTST